MLLVARGLFDEELIVHFSANHAEQIVAENLSHRKNRPISLYGDHVREMRVGWTLSSLVLRANMLAIALLLSCTFHISDFGTDFGTPARGPHSHHAKPPSATCCHMVPVKLNHSDLTVPQPWFMAEANLCVPWRHTILVGLGWTIAIEGWGKGSWSVTEPITDLPALPLGSNTVILATRPRLCE